MKKVLVVGRIDTVIGRERSFLGRSDFEVVTVNTKEKALAVHSSEEMDLIIVGLDIPEMSCERFCSIIRDDPELRKVSIIVVCPDNEADIERGSKCKSNACIATPSDPGALLEKAHQLLNISRRESYRVLLSAKIHGSYRNRFVLCRSENISASGILVETDKRLACGDIMTCSFFLPDSAQVIAEGKIVRVSKRMTEFDTNQYGIKFLDISPESRTAIEAFVERESRERGL